MLELVNWLQAKVCIEAIMSIEDGRQPARIRELLDPRVLGPANVTTFNVLVLSPAWGIVDLPDCTLVLFGGAQNVATAAAVLAGYSTSPHLLAIPVVPTVALTLIDNILVGHEAQVDANKPLVLAGHSYGGALATFLAASARVRSAERRIVLHTFGSPKQGAAELARFLEGVSIVRWNMEDDPVPLFPPAPVQLPFLTPQRAIAELGGWGEYHAFGRGITLDKDGGSAAEDFPSKAALSTTLNLLGWVSGFSSAEATSHKSIFYVEAFRALERVSNAEALRIANAPGKPAVAPIEARPRVNPPAVAPGAFPPPAGGDNATQRALNGATAGLALQPGDGFGRITATKPFTFAKVGKTWFVCHKKQYLWSTRGRKAAKRAAAKLNSSLAQYQASPNRDWAAVEQSVREEFN